MDVNQFKIFLSNSKEVTLENGIWHVNNTQKQSYPEDGHDDYYEIEDDSFWFQHRNNCILSLIKKFSPGNIFFDVGGGNGFVTKAVEEAQIPAILIEPVKQAVINAQKRNLNNIFCGTLGDLKGLAGQLPSVGAFDVIEHIRLDEMFISEIWQMLKSGGYFYLTVPAYQCLWSNEDDIAGHHKRYSRKGIVKLLQQSNFEVEFSSYIFSILVLPLFLIRVLPSKLKLRNKSKAKVQNEHKKSSGVVGKILDSIWSWELGRINSQKSMPFGSSCIIVARKP